MSKRAERRRQLANAKRRARDQLRVWRRDTGQPQLTGREVGRAAAMHCTCSCGLCANPRRLFGEKSLRERSDEFFAKSVCA